MILVRKVGINGPPRSIAVPNPKKTLQSSAGYMTTS